MTDAPVEERQRGFKDETTYARMQRLFEERIRMEQEEAEMWSRGQVLPYPNFSLSLCFVIYFFATRCPA
jgi:hypothetical protein